MIDKSSAVNAWPSLFEVLQRFLIAQKLDLQIPKQLGPGVTMIQADDDASLVNTYVAYEPDANSSPSELGEVLRRSTAEPPRTDIVTPDSMSSQIPELSKAVQGVAHRILPLSDFLDEFVRPARICSELMVNEDDQARPARGGGRSVNGITAENLLLSEGDFIDDQYAIAAGMGKFEALNHLYTGWALGTSPRLCIVIAPAGHGKSKITHILAKRLARHYTKSSVGARPPLPILIPFGQYRRGSVSFGGLLLEALNRFGASRLTIEAFQYLVALGRILFILDGYDEMVEADPEVARDNIAEFVRRAGPRSRILLTARSNFYRTSSDVVGQVGDPMLAESEVEVVELLPFDLTQAKAYIAKRLADVSDRSRLMERAQGMLQQDRSLEVLGSPIFLYEFVNLIAEEKLSIPDVRKRGSLEFLIQRTFKRERERQNHDFSDEQQRRYLEAIAFDLLTTGDAGYPRDDLEVFAAEVANQEQLQSLQPPTWEQLWGGLASHHFLLPDDENINLASVTMRQTVTMRHQVWREYFQGSGVVARLGDGDKASRYADFSEKERGKAFDQLSTRDLPEGVLRSAAAFMTEPARYGLLAKLSGSGDKLVRNMLRMALARRESEAGAMLVLPQEISSQLSGRDLSEISFLRIRFDGSLANTNLTGCLFEHCDLSAAELDGTLLNRTVFSSCELPATLAKADVASVTIDGEPLFGPQLKERYGEIVAEGEPGSLRAAEGAEFRQWATEIVKGRLAKFLRHYGGEANAIFDTSISWTAFMGGVDPKHRDFVVRRVYRAMHAVQLVSEVPTGASPRPAVRITKDQDMRAEVQAFVRNGVIGPSIERVIDRVIGRPVR